MNIAQVIEWKYGRVAGCNLDTGEITSWAHPTIPQPTPAQLVLDTAEYTAVIPKAEMWTKIKAERERRKFTGGFKVGTLWFNSDANSRSQYNTISR